MKHFNKILTIGLLLITWISCDEGLVQSDDKTVADNDSQMLKCTITDECTTETAWSAGNNYVTKGNWATYTPAPRLSNKKTCVDLFAGQNMLAGLVCFYNLDYFNFTVRIYLDPCWSLQDVSEAIKIQGYENVPPARNPNPGRFATYKGNGVAFENGYIEVLVPKYNEQGVQYKYYGIHIDVQDCCVKE